MAEAHSRTHTHKNTHSKLLFAFVVHNGLLKHIFCFPKRCMKPPHIYFTGISPLKQSHTCSNTHTHTHSHTIPCLCNPDTQTAAVLVAFRLVCDEGVTFLHLLLSIFFTVQLFSDRVSLGTEGSEGVTEVAAHSSTFSPPLLHVSRN